MWNSNKKSTTENGEDKAPSPRKSGCTTTKHRSVEEIKNIYFAVKNICAASQCRMYQLQEYVTQLKAFPKNASEWPQT